MKKFSILFLITLNLSLASQTTNWSWARAANGISTGSDEAQDLAVDVNGNVFITGSFSDPAITFTSSSASVTLTNSNTNGMQEIFLAKYDAAGNLLWAKSAAGSMHDQGRSVTTDGAGNVYITGFFESPTLVIGTTTLINASSTGQADIYVAKFGPGGNLLWATRHGGALNEWGMSIAADLSGNVYLTGVFHSLGVSFGNFGVINSGSGDAYVAKLNTNGTGQWAKQIGGDQYDQGVNISVDASSNVYVGGDFSSAVLGFSPNIANAGGADIFIAKFDLNGNDIFSKGIGGTNDDHLWSITHDALQNTYIAGTYQSNPLVIGNTSLPKFGTRDMFTAAFNTTGNATWAVRNTGNSFSSPHTVKADLLGNLYVSGFIVNMYPMTFGNTTLNSSESAASYIMKYNALTGQDLWGTTTKARGRTLDLDVFGNVHLAGSFGGTVTIGSHTLTSDIQAQGEIFVAKMCSLPVITGTNMSVCAGLTGSLNINVPPGFMSTWFPTSVGGSPLITASTFTTANSGTFYVELSDTILGCGYTGPRIAFTVTVNQTPTISVANGSLITGAGQNISIQWYDCDYGSIMTGANSGSFVPPAPSAYAVIVTNGACTDTSDCFRMQFPVGIAQTGNFEKQILIYPNPNSGSSVVYVNENGIYGIYNVMGQLLKNIDLEKSKNELNFPDLENGIYFIRKDNTVLKFVIEK